MTLMVLFVAVVYNISQDWWLCGVCVLVLLFSVDKFYLPTTFVIESKTLTIYSLLKKKKTVLLSDIKSYYRKANRIYLFSEREPLAIVSSRATAVDLPADEELRNRLLDFLAKKKLRSLGEEK